MGLIKYELQRHVENEPNAELVFVGAFETKVVGRKKYIELKDQGWELTRKRYYMISASIDRWSRLTTNDKIAVLGIAVTIILGLLDIY